MPIDCETIPPGEAEAIQRILGAIEKTVRTEAKSGLAHRDAHRKAHGCVKAEFRVLENLAPELRVGVFAQARAFEAWVRFSNCSAAQQPDTVADGRAMAIKLMNVIESPSTTQDFLTINFPAFLVRNAIDYVEFQTFSSQLFFFFSLFPFRFRFHEYLMARAILQQPAANMLNIRYWSVVPSKFGDKACKFSIRPAAKRSVFTAKSSADFLRDNLVQHLAKSDAVFDFMVQLRVDGHAMPIEDPTIVWDEVKAPFVPVATLTIPKQEFDSPQQRMFGENLSFNPWHCVAEHRPLGGINRVRKVVYEHISQLRHELNVAPRKEPVDFTL